tara:strand:+ start:1692 stop:1874 length:183 start_codon:yes stop_codon:yes gene_type:complete
MRKQNSTAPRDPMVIDPMTEAICSDPARLDRFLNDLGIKAEFDRIIDARVKRREDQRRQG